MSVFINENLKFLNSVLLINVKNLVSNILKTKRKSVRKGAFLPFLALCYINIKFKVLLTIYTFFDQIKEKSFLVSRYLYGFFLGNV